MTKKNNLKIKVYLFNILLGFFALPSFYAQQESQVTQYTDNILHYNPAYAGSRDMMNFTLLHRQQWVGIEGAPMTSNFLMHTPIKFKNIGLGFSVLNDRIGPLNQNWINADFSYSLRFSNDARLNLGMKGGVSVLNGRISELFAIDENDVLLTDNYANELSPNFGFGMFYHTDEFYIGASSPKILDDIYSLPVEALRNQRHYYLVAGGYINVNRMLKIRPAGMVKITENAPFAADLSVAAIFYDQFWLGGNYRFDESAGLFFQLQLSPQLKAGYAFDLSTTSLMLHNFGTHEILLSYDLNFKEKEIMNPRYF